MRIATSRVQLVLRAGSEDEGTKDYRKGQANRFTVRKQVLFLEQKRGGGR